MSTREFRNSDVVSVDIAVPEGHRHMRTTIRLRGGEELVFQEATIANLVRAFLEVKTHPQKSGCRLTGREVDREQLKEGFAGWQLLEDRE